MRRPGLALVALLCAPAAVGAVPAGPPPVVAPPGAACAPAPAWLQTPRGDVWLSSPSWECRYVPDPGTGASRVVVSDGTLVSGTTPRLVLRAGERVTLHVSGAAPTGAPLLEALPSPRAPAGRPVVLSPVTRTWRVRPGSGVLRFTVGQTGALGPRTGVYAAVYRAGTRPVLPGDPPPAVRRRAPLPPCGIERLRQGDDGARSRPRACLARAIASGRRAELISVRPTIEGDPITTVVRLVRPGRVDLIVDTIRDRFGPRGWTTLTCSAIDPTTLRPSGCGSPRRPR
jgi:hypothetical protein